VRSKLPEDIRLQLEIQKGSHEAELLEIFVKNSKNM
jgi:hypothetical protein